MPAGASEDFLFCAVEIDSLLLLLLLLLEYVCYGSYTVVTTMIRPPMTKIPMFIFPEVVEYSADSRTSNRGRLFVRYRPLITAVHQGCNDVICQSYTYALPKNRMELESKSNRSCISGIYSCLIQPRLSAKHGPTAFVAQISPFPFNAALSRIK